ncbi:hypothetical protein EGX89_16930 [Citrobacter freundii]|nr:hypothetical protein EGX89_16930 [Citrobacter freundii]
MRHLYCSEVSISPLFRWPNSVNHFTVGLAVLTLISVRAMLMPSLLVQALSNRKYHHLYQHLLVDVR